MSSLTTFDRVSVRWRSPVATLYVGKAFRWMFPLSRIFGSGRNREKSRPDPLSVFPEVNAGVIAGKLRVDQRGAERGLENIPSTQAPGLDEVEQEIVNEVKSIRDKGLDACDEYAQVYSQRTQRMGTNNAVMQIQNQCNTTVNDFHAEVIRYKYDLENALIIYQQTKISFQQFRNDNRIKDPPHDENGFPRWFAISLLIVALESVLNGVFLAKAHEMGLVGGIGIALAISVVNVGLASLAGLVTRNFNHVRVWRKVVGTLSFVGAVSLALMFNFVVAHFRDAMTAAVWDQAAGRAVERAIALQLPESIDAWLLALLGLLAAALAGWKTYSADHPYPGYGRISRKVKESYENYDEKRDNAITILTERRDDFNERLSNANAGMSDALRAKHEYAFLLKKRESFLQQCDDTVNGLLTRYRGANQAKRTQLPPEHFDERYDFPKAETLDSALDGLPSDMQLPDAGLKAEVRDALDKIHSAYRDAINAFSVVDRPDNPMP